MGGFFSHKETNHIGSRYDADDGPLDENGVSRVVVLFQNVVSGNYGDESLMAAHNDIHQFLQTRLSRNRMKKPLHINRGGGSSQTVSYGAGGRESIGFTSLRPDALTLETRRTLPTLAGRLLEPQEKRMTCPAADAQTRLALCSALLLLDLDA